MSNRKSKKGKLRRETAEEKYELPTPSSLPEKFDSKFLLDSVLKHASLTGTFFDTKFFAFSRRKSNGVVYAPKALYANGWLLRAKVPNYFEQLFSDTFKDSISGNLADGFPIDRKDYTDDYDFDDDSDLEDDNFFPVLKPFMESSTTDSLGLPWDPVPPADIGGEQIDDVHVSEPSAGESGAKVDAAEPLIRVDAAEPLTKVDAAEPLTKVPGRIVVLSYTAFSTWNALLWYLCRGKVSFKRLRSERRVIDVVSTPTFVPEILPPQCSPKSMYRLADMLGLNELKVKAKQDVISKIDSKNIYAELLSTFTSTYDEFQEAKIGLVCRNSDFRRAVMQKMPVWIDGIASGELLHTKDLLGKLIVKLN